MQRVLITFELRQLENTFNPKSVQSLIQRAPRNVGKWDTQVVLKTKLLNDTTGPAQIVAALFLVEQLELLQSLRRP